jgi:hypothetical protein
MKIWLIRFVFLLVILIQLYWAFEYRTGGTLLPRSPQTVAAGEAYKLNPSPETLAEVRAQMHADSQRNSRHGQMVLLSMLLADITAVAIYVFWMDRRKRE